MSNPNRETELAETREQWVKEMMLGKVEDIIPFKEWLEELTKRE